MERRGSNQQKLRRSESEAFNGLVHNMELTDIPMIGRKYTWYSSSRSAMSRLDRVLLSTKWLDLWPDCKQYILDRQLSDHCAIILKHNTIDWGPKPFRTLDVWWSFAGFDKVV